MLQGVFKARKKSGEEYFRASITYQNKHVSLGSFLDENAAAEAYCEAKAALYGKQEIAEYKETMKLDFKKWVSLINFRDHDMYIKTPIYLQKKYFEYYLSPERALKFDVDDLFYYSHHTIMERAGYMFVADYGMQVNILSRYGIKNFAVEGRDFCFANGDSTDYRYGNVVVINKYHGVMRFEKDGRIYYRARIHIVGDYVVGIYQTEIEAAIAYNKAADLVKRAGIEKEFPQNYIEEISAIEYARIYNRIPVSKKIRELEQRY